MFVALLAPASAHAAKGGIPFVYNTGQETFRTGPLPEPFCKPVAFKGDDDDSSQDEAKDKAA